MKKHQILDSGSGVFFGKRHIFRFFFLLLVLDGFCGRHIVKISYGMLVCQFAVHPDIDPENDRNEDRCEQTDLEHSACAVKIEDGTDECDDIKK